MHGIGKKNCDVIAGLYTVGQPSGSIVSTAIALAAMWTSNTVQPNIMHFALLMIVGTSFRMVLVCTFTVLQERDG